MGDSIHSFARDMFNWPTQSQEDVTITGAVARGDMLDGIYKPLSVRVGTVGAGEGSNTGTGRNE